MSDTQLIKDKIDIVDFIGEYVQLKPAGVNHKGLCPFHGERTPSFMVSRERNSWHCFGCSKGGDIFSFVEDMEGMEFVEALKMLADRAGVAITYSGGSKEQGSQKTRIKDINAVASHFFFNFLIKMPSAKPALDYLHSRGIRDETIEEWQIGYVPDQWDLLTQYLLKKGHGIDDLVVAGLTIRRDNANAKTGQGFYDRFRGRIMFPIHDVHGSVVGFTGRVQVETEKSGGKYVNTPQTAVYDKSRVVYGLYRAKKEIKTNNLIVMVEGQTDVISSHQVGIKNVVASSGTALTEHQVKILKRYSNNINMAFDSDDAGQKAAKRGIDIALQEGMSIKVIQIPEGLGKDPDQCIKNNSQVWTDSIKNAKHIMSWYLQKALADKDLNDPHQKQIVADEVLPEIARIPFAVEKDHWLRELSSKLNVEVGVLREDLARISSNQKSKVISHKSNSQTPMIQLSKLKSDRLTLLFERFFAVVIKFNGNLKSEILNLKSEWISTSTYQSLYNALKKDYTSIEQVRIELDVENTENIVDVLQMKGDLVYAGMDEDGSKKEAVMLVEQIQKEWTKARRFQLQHQIELAEKAGDSERLNELIKEFQEVQS
jgi:DNA primase